MRIVILKHQYITINLFLQKLEKHSHIYIDVHLYSYYNRYKSYNDLFVP